MQRHACTQVSKKGTLVEEILKRMIIHQLISTWRSVQIWIDCIRFNFNGADRDEMKKVAFLYKAKHPFGQYWITPNTSYRAYTWLKSWTTLKTSCVDRISVLRKISLHHINSSNNSSSNTNTTTVYRTQCIVRIGMKKSLSLYSNGFNIRRCHQINSNTLIPGW